jgi:hypothetical protein
VAETTLNLFYEIAKNPQELTKDKRWTGIVYRALKENGVDQPIK